MVSASTGWMTRSSAAVAFLPHGPRATYTSPSLAAKSWSSFEPVTVGSKRAGAMRIAILSDIHGNLTALDAVIADLKKTSPDLVAHGGDLVGGSRNREVIDLIRERGWPG